MPWRAVWPGALGATLAIAVVDYAFPVYLTNISTIARFGTTIVFMLIMLGWFYVLALIILGGAVVNALRLRPLTGVTAAPMAASRLPDCRYKTRSRRDRSLRRWMTHVELR